jgi:hypothetical protein
MASKRTPKDSRPRDGEPVERPPWEAEFYRRIITFLAKQGSPVSLEPSYYAWHAEDWQELVVHLKTCLPDYPRCTFADLDWREFAGTFAEESASYRRGLEAVIYCSCGSIAGRHWRYEGSRGDLLNAITAPEA